MPRPFEVDASPKVDCLHQEKDPELSIYLPIPIPLWFLSLFSLGFPLSKCILFPSCVCRRSSSSFCFLPSTPAPNGRHHVSLGRVSLSPCASLRGLTGLNDLMVYLSTFPVFHSGAVFLYILLSVRRLYVCRSLTDTFLFWLLH